LEKRTWSGRVVLRYAVLQVPGLLAAGVITALLARWGVLPGDYTWVVLVLWILKDVLLFPFVWRAYDWEEPGQTGSMIGKRGRVTRKLAPSGYVQIGGELWIAEAAEPMPPIEEGTWITVERAEGLRLFVRPVRTVS
jgi:membrane protein implicated in regulation of membrane protease activity